MTTCNECKKPKCDGEVTLYYEGAAFSCSICDNRFASGLAAIHRCHGHAPQPTAQPVDLTKLIGRVSAGKENYPYVHPPVILTTERDEIVLALRVLRVLRTTKTGKALSVYMEDDGNSTPVVFDETQNDVAYLSLEDWEAAQFGGRDDD